MYNMYQDWFLCVRVTHFDWKCKKLPYIYSINDIPSPTSEEVSTLIPVNYFIPTWVQNKIVTSKLTRVVFEN